MVEPWMDFYFVAKRELNTCAGINGQIPWTAIRDYAETYGLSLDEMDDLTRMVRAMEHGVHMAEKDLESEKPKDNKKGG